MSIKAEVAARPGFREPWTHGAKAYTQADTFAALREGMKRKRNSRIIHMPNSGEAGDMPCASCGIKLKDPYAVNKGGPLEKTDTYSTWHYSPKSKSGYGQHYYCSWGSLMEKIVSIRL